MIQAPVSLFPLGASAAKSGGIVIAVLIGLALYMAHSAQQQAQKSRTYP